MEKLLKMEVFLASVIKKRKTMGTNGTLPSSISKIITSQMLRRERNLRSLSARSTKRLNGKF
jgi:hypothetical protein